MKKVKASNFVKRQTEESSYGHYSGSWSELEDLVIEHFDERTDGYRDGVVLVPVPKDGFFTSIVELSEDDTFYSEYSSRQPGEAPQLSTNVVGKSKSPANFVNIVLYRADVLAEDDDRSTDAEWEIISINAAPCEELPMDPVTMMRNELHLKGGTKASYSKEQYIEAIRFWASHSTVFFS